MTDSFLRFILQRFIPMSIFHRIAISCLIVWWFSLPGYSQFNIIRQAQSRMEKQNWATAHELLNKSLRKDSTNATAKYFLSIWFLKSENPSFQIDSAFHYICDAIISYDALPLKEKEKLRKIPIDSSIMIIQKMKVDSAAFHKTKKINTESVYQEFLEKFKGSPHAAEAKELRNEVGYLNALRANTYKSFSEYLLRYPDSQRKSEALARYHNLLFEEKTHDHKTTSYQAFINEFPNSPYRHEAERKLFEVLTANGSPESFQSFLKKNPTGSYASFARALLFHWYAEMEIKMPDTLFTDSLRQCQRLNETYWVPLYKNEKYGFMDADGNETMAPKFDGVPESYLCGAIQPDILETANGYFARTGTKIADTTDSVKDIGFGFLEISKNGCKKLFHKSGRKIIDACSDNYQIVANQFIKRASEGAFSLYTLSGVPLQKKGDEITSLANVILIKNLGKISLYTPEQLAMAVESKAVTSDFVFDHVTLLEKDKLLVRNGALEGVMNSSLEFLIPLARQTFFITPFGLLKRHDNTYSIEGVSTELDHLTAENISIHDQWLLLRTTGYWKLFNLRTHEITVEKADSIWFDQHVAFSREGDSIRASFPMKGTLTFSRDSKLIFIHGADTIRCFYTEIKNKKTVFDFISGAKLFVADFDKIEMMHKNLFVITRKGKKILLTKEGKRISPLEFNEVIRLDGHSIALLHQKKFGLYRADKNQLIKPAYDKNITLLGDDKLIVYKDGFFGLLGSDLKAVTNFEFSEIRPWSDSLIWVKNNLEWKLLNYHTQKTLIDHVKSFQLIRNDQEMVAIIHRDSFYGVVSSRKGYIIPSTFNDIINIGTGDHPLYFTEKNIEEAGIYVVIYYNASGKLLRRQIFEQAEYSKIYCNEN